jgi:hypothetical protein
MTDNLNALRPMVFNIGDKVRLRKDYDYVREDGSGWRWGQRELEIRTIRSNGDLVFTFYEMGCGLNEMATSLLKSSLGHLGRCSHPQP